MIGDRDVGGNRIKNVGDAVAVDDALTLRSALTILGNNPYVLLKFSGKASLGVGALAAFCGDVPDTTYAAAPGYNMPRQFEATDLYLNFSANTATQQVTITVLKNGVATVLFCPKIAGTTGVAHLGLAAGSGVAFTPNDVLDVEVSAPIGTGDVTFTAMVFGQPSP